MRRGHHYHHPRPAPPPPEKAEKAERLSLEGYPGVLSTPALPEPLVTHRASPACGPRAHAVPVARVLWDARVALAEGF